MWDQGQPARLSRKYGRGQALWFGLPLGALTLGILLLAVKFPTRLSPGPAILIGLSLYIIIPLFAGYRYCYQQPHEGWESGWAGFRVGLVAAALLMLVVTVLLIIANVVDANTPPPPPGNIRTFHSTTLDIIVSVFALGVMAALAGTGVLLGAIGARVGGALAIWRARSAMPAGNVQEA